jgi:predicted hotdog family 3-hydroxylacyl-ACP dehydratase
VSFPDIEQLLAHRAPMRWVDEVVASEPEGVQCRLTVRADHVFVHGGTVEPIVAVEWMAQAIAALVGLRDRQKNEDVRPGYLIAVPEATFAVDSFGVGDVLDLFARRVWGDDELASFECRVERAGETAATAQISVYRRALPPELTGGAAT